MATNGSFTVAVVLEATFQNLPGHMILYVLSCIDSSCSKQQFISGVSTPHLGFRSLPPSPHMSTPTSPHHHHLIPLHYSGPAIRPIQVMIEQTSQISTIHITNSMFYSTILPNHLFRPITITNYRRLCIIMPPKVSKVLIIFSSNVFDETVTDFVSPAVAEAPEQEILKHPPPPPPPHLSVCPSHLVFTLTRTHIAVFSQNFPGMCTMSWGCAV